MIIEILFYTSLTEIKVDELNEAAKASCDLVKAHIDLYENQTATNWKLTVVAQEKVYEIIQNSEIIIEDIQKAMPANRQLNPDILIEALDTELQ